MKIGIIAAMPEELAYLVQHLDNAQEQVVLGIPIIQEPLLLMKSFL